MKPNEGWFERLRNALTRRGPAGTPSNLDAGISFIESGDYEHAINTLSEETRRDPRSVTALYSLGTAFILHGQTENGLSAMDEALRLDPNCWPALINSAKVKIGLNRLPEITAAFQKVTSLSQMPVDAALPYARSLVDTRQFTAAFQVLFRYRRQLKDSPDYWLLFGVSCQFIGLSTEAEAAFRHYRSLGPVAPEMESRHARLIGDKGEYGQSSALLSRYMMGPAQTSETTIAYARVQEIQGDRTAAAKIYEDILAADPKHVEALTNLGNLTKASKDFVRSESLYRRGLELSPTSATLHKNLSNLLGATFRAEEAVQELERSVELSPSNPYNLSDLIFSQHYLKRVEQNEFKAHAGTWGRKHGTTQKQIVRPKNSNAKTPLRIGLISGSFRQHPVGFLALAGLEQLDRTEFSITCYANQVGGDSYTERFRKLSDRWRQIVHLNDEHLTSLIREDRIDILIEMSGHAAGHRLPVVARRVAPLQIKWIGGQFNTMGIDAIDYFLSDPVESPSSHDDLYFERIHRLPSVYACYEPPVAAPTVGSLPALTNEYITFGSLNKLNKISPETVSLWSACLRAVPDSRLILQNETFDDPNSIEHAYALFAAHKIDASRIQCIGFTPHPDLFRTYHRIDIALDPHPYSGCLTTCEALWMGVPVVTLPGPTFAGRHSASFLSATGLPDWIADDEDHYIRIISEKCVDLEALSELRKNLRQKMAQSPLCNAEQFGQDLGTALKTMWKENSNESRPQAA